MIKIKSYNKDLRFGDFKHEDRVFSSESESDEETSATETQEGQLSQDVDHMTLAQLAKALKKKDVLGVMNRTVKNVLAIQEGQAQTWDAFDKMRQMLKKKSDTHK